MSGISSIHCCHFVAGSVSDGLCPFEHVRCKYVESCEAVFYHRFYGFRMVSF